MVLNIFKRITNKLKRMGGFVDETQKTKPPHKTPRKKKSARNKTDHQDITQATPEKRTTAKQKKPRKNRQTHFRKHDKKHVSGTPATPLPTAWQMDEFDVPLTDGKLRFHDLDLPIEIMHAVFDLGFKYCTPIQAEIMPSTLSGKDATGRAQTGTGKTAAFLITIFTALLRKPSTGERKRRSGTPRALVLAPTRELAIQIVKEAQNLSQYTPFNTVAIFGGIEYEKQRRALKGRQVDVMVATPGRLLDSHRRHDVHLSQVEILVIDEADRMLDMGFIPDVRKIIYSTPPKNNRQTLLFSATLTEEVTRLSTQWTRDQVKVEIEPEQVAVDSVNQVVYIVTTDEKMALLYNIITRQNLERVIVFCNRRDETRRLTELLRRYGVNCAMISGEILQKKRIKTLENFRSGKIRVMVATDVAGRGLHIEGVSHVINYTLPHDPEDYVHRIGRTGRAGATGTSISFACEEDSFHLPDIETFLGHELPCTHPDEDWLALPPKPRKTDHKRPQNPRRRRRTRRRRKPRDGKARDNRDKRVPRGGGPRKNSTSNKRREKRS